MWNSAASRFTCGKTCGKFLSGVKAENTEQATNVAKCSWFHSEGCVMVPKLVHVDWYNSGASQKKETFPKKNNLGQNFLQNNLHRKTLSMGSKIAVAKMGWFPVDTSAAGADPGRGRDRSVTWVPRAHPGFWSGVSKVRVGCGPKHWTAVAKPSPTGQNRPTDWWQANRFALLLGSRILVKGPRTECVCLSAHSGFCQGQCHKQKDRLYPARFLAKGPEQVNVFARGGFRLLVLGPRTDPLLPYRGPAACRRPSARRRRGAVRWAGGSGRGRRGWSLGAGSSPAPPGPGSWSPATKQATPFHTKANAGRENVSRLSKLEILFIYADSSACRSIQSWWKWRPCVWRQISN